VQRLRPVPQAARPPTPHLAEDRCHQEPQPRQDGRARAQEGSSPLSLPTADVHHADLPPQGEAINGLAAAHPDADGQLGLAQHRRASGKISSGLSDRSQSPISRTGTPNFAHPSNIAPQHMFEQALSSDAVFHPSFGLRQPSPGSTSSINGSHLEPPLSYDSLAAQNTALKTRVSEMELINDLFRNRVSELETSESQARATEAGLRAELEAVQQRERELKRRIEEIEEESPRHKKMKMSDLVDESRAGSPISAMVE
jgi:GATA-binding protein